LDSVEAVIEFSPFAKGKFWALSRHAHVLADFKNVSRFSNAHGVSNDPAAQGPRANSVDVQGFAAPPILPGVGRGA
jgi:hypothetical protein